MPMAFKHPGDTQIHSSSLNIPSALQSCTSHCLVSKHSEDIGKELKIRLWLSRKCLYSSWFEIEKSFHLSSFTFHLSGHGWGHGAGLCQIGAAQMAEEGFSYEQILAHYYVGTRIGVATK